MADDYRDNKGRCTSCGALPSEFHAIDCAVLLRAPATFMPPTPPEDPLTRFNKVLDEYADTHAKYQEVVEKLRKAAMDAEITHDFLTHAKAFVTSGKRVTVSRKSAQ